MPVLPFTHRREAGRLLAASLTDLASRTDVVVLGLPRGGIPVAWEVAHALAAPLDACIVRKLGVPGQEELAMGAIGPGNVEILNHPLVQDLGVDRASIDGVIQRERQELTRRETRYRQSRPTPNLTDRIVILVDDGLATGATMLAAIQVAREADPRQIIVAVPVGAASVVEALRREVNRVECLATPTTFTALGTWYEDFRPTSDSEVIALLNTPTT